jgi:hypothetical protein
LQVFDPHAWNAGALLVLSAVAAVPPEIVAAHPILRATAPVLAGVGIALKSREHYRSQKAAAVSPAS